MDYDDEKTENGKPHIRHKKIELIKFLRVLTGFGLVEAKWLVEQFNMANEEWRHLTEAQYIARLALFGGKFLRGEYSLAKDGCFYKIMRGKPVEVNLSDIERETKSCTDF